MTIAYWCVLAAAVMPYVFTGIAKAGVQKVYNNKRPRESLDKMSGYQQRANWAQLNSFEAFPAFAAAVIIAHLAQAPQGMVDALALAFIGIRIVYGALYLANLHVQRSLVWTAGFACVVALFVVAA